MGEKIERAVGRFRGKEIHVADARMQLTDDELMELEVTLENGKVVRPFRGLYVAPHTPPKPGVTSI